MDPTANLTGLTANGSATETTTKLSLTFDRDITGLTAADLTLQPGTTGAVKGELTKTPTATGKYELALSGINQGGEVTVTVAKQGYIIVGSPKSVTVNYYSSAGDTPATFTNLTADGSAEATTTKLSLTFDKDITGLTAGDIDLEPGDTGAAKGALTKTPTATGKYELAISGISNSGTVTVTVAKPGYDISGGTKQVTVYYNNGQPLTQVAFTGLTADGSNTQTTAKLSLTFDKDITGLAAGNITLGGSTGAAKGELSSTGTGTYDLALSGITQGGTVTVAVAKSGYNISPESKEVTVYYNSGEPLTQAAFTGLSADGSATQTTTKLSLTFDKDITGLTAENITLQQGTTGAVKGELTKTSTETGKYDLAISGITQGGTVTVTVFKSGYNITGSPNPVTVYYAISAAFNTLTANGSTTETTTKLSLTFDKDISGLAAGDIDLVPGTTGAVKGELTKTSTGAYDLAISNITQGGQVIVTVAKSGYNITGGAKTVTVNYAISAAFNSLIADGSATENTTKLSLTFDKDITGLTAADLTLNAGSTGAAKGELSRTGTGTYDLALSGITQGGEISLSLNKTGYNITGSPKTAQVFYYNPGNATLTITFAQIADSAPSITGPTLYRLSNSGPTTAALTVENPDQYTSISWQVQDTAVTGTGDTFTLSAANAAYNQIAEHFVTVTVMKDGVPYNKTVTFKVEL